MWLAVSMICMFLSVNLYLFCVMSKKEKVMAATIGKESSVFSSEKTKLIVITTVFLVSYLVDVVYY